VLEVVEDATGLCFFGVELFPIPFQHPVVLFVLGVGHGVNEVGVSGEATHIFRGACPNGPDKARVCSTRDGVVDFFDLDHMVPVAAKVIDVMDGLGADIFENTQQAGFVRGQRAIVIAVSIWHAPANTAGPELIKVAVGPSHRGLDHVVQAVQLDLEWHIEAPQHLRLYIG
jgi:hypothetical protein